MRRVKVFVHSDGGLVPFPPQQSFEIQASGGIRRLVVTTKGSPLELMCDIVADLGGALSCTYELRGDVEASSVTCSTVPFLLLRELTARFQDLLESDPRHNFIVSCGSESSVTLDEHNFLIVRGEVDAVKRFLQSQSYEEAMVNYPTPHVHTIYPEFDDQERDLIAFLSAKT